MLLSIITVDQAHVAPGGKTLINDSDDLFFTEGTVGAVRAGVKWVLEYAEELTLAVSHAHKLFGADIGHLAHRLCVRRQNDAYQDIGITRIRIIVRHLSLSSH